MTKTPLICCFGESLWDLLPTGRRLGGAPLNVAAHLHQFGLPAAIISRIGSDSLGDEIRNWISAMNLPAYGMQTDTGYPTGIVKVDVSDVTHARYEIVQPAAWDFITYNEELGELIKNAKALVYGTLACRNTVSKSCLDQLLQSGATKIYDVNLRPPFYTQALVESLMQQADIVKMNDDELRLIASWYEGDLATEQNSMNFLKNKFGLRTVVVTRGAHGAALLNEQGYFETPGYRVEVVNTIGSGDAFLAGFICKFLQGANMEAALNFASATGALVAMHPGAIPVISETAIEQMIQQAKV